MHRIPFYAFLWVFFILYIPFYLLKKLQETKGDVTLHELGEYIRQEVHAKGAIENLLQTPCVTPSSAVGGEWREWKLK